MAWLGRAWFPKGGGKGAGRPVEGRVRSSLLLLELPTEAPDRVEGMPPLSPDRPPIGSNSVRLELPPLTTLAAMPEGNVTGPVPSGALGSGFEVGTLTGRLRSYSPPGAAGRGCLLDWPWEEWEWWDDRLGGMGCTRLGDGVGRL